jgi:hypothetical protein
LAEGFLRNLMLMNGLGKRTTVLPMSVRVRLGPRRASKLGPFITSTTDIVVLFRHVRFVPILLQKSKVASARIFGETLKREAIVDSDNLSRATEVAYEFSVRR